MEKRSFSAFFRDYESIDGGYEFQMLAVAVQCDLKTILPMLYVDCATAPIDVILKASNRINLGKEQTEKLLRGHEHMIDYVRRYGINQFLPQHYCSMACSQARGTLLQNYVIIPPEFPIQRLLQNLGPHPDDDDPTDREAVCKSCTKLICEGLEGFRREIWESIPRLFDLGSWEDVKRD